MSSIAPAIRSPIPQWIISTSSQITVERVGAVFSVIEAVFYSSLQSRLSSARWIGEIAWAKECYSESLQKIHTAFNVANGFLIFAYISNVLVELNRYSKNNPLKDITEIFFTLSAFAPIFILPSNTNQEGAKKLHIVRLLLNVPLIYFAENRLIPVAALISTTFSMWKNTQIDYSALPKPEDFKESQFAENAYAAYNIAQATLAYFQKYPEFSHTIYKIQQVLLIVDLGWIIWSTQVLYKKIKDQSVVRTMWTPGIEFIIKLPPPNAVAIYATAIVFSYFATLSLQTHLQLAVPLKELWNQIGGMSKEFKTLDIQWRFATLLQSVYCFRMLLSGALVCFSERLSAHLISLFAQRYSLSAIPNLKWIELTWTIPKSLLTTYAKEETDLTAFSTTARFLVDHHCTQEAAHLQSTLQSIYTYASNLLQQSKWESYWLASYQNGKESNRSYYYGVMVPKPSLSPCGCTLVPQVTSLFFEGFRAIYGDTKFTVSFK